MKKLFILFFFSGIILTSGLLAYEVSYAWFLSIEYKPDSKEIMNIPIKKLNPNWIYAKELTLNDAPAEKREKFAKEMKDDGYGFSYDIDVNKDSRKEKILIGVYKNKKNETGRFLLILKNGQSNKWEKDYLYEWPGKAGFSILYLNKGEVSWYSCLECDIGCHLKRVKGKYELEWIDCC